MLKSRGFKVHYATYLFSFLTIPIFMFRTIPSLLSIAKDPSKVDNQKDDHRKKGGVISTFLEKTLKWELKRIINLKKIPWGSSCFIIAQKR
jgi:hypothetical protein